ncbi:MAG TPA: squalene/phytoene synthase family protein [Thermoanaerobaculia bacterium]|jgi:phytoene/squalene synthetase|nr:squalene/phytoene synthase family protein [Thermoanaerobaculia bacterium]
MAGGSIERHPDDPAWRADALGASRHSRLADEMRPPDLVADPQAAIDVCADLARSHLGDFSPALALLTRPERRRAQALVAHVAALFDFARQRGIEGERLSAINRWEYALDEALAGRVAGQPIFAAMSREQGRRRWSAEGLDALSACARRRALRGCPATPDEAERDARALAQAFGRTWIGNPVSSEIEALGASLIRLDRLQRLGSETAAGRCPLPWAETEGMASTRPAEPSLLAAARKECARLRVLFLGGARGLPALPAGYRQSVAYALFAGLALLSQIEEADGNLLVAPPRIGLRARLGLLARARWLRV